MNANESRSIKMKKVWRNPFYRFRMRKYLKRLHQFGENASHYKKVKLTGKIAELYPDYNKNAQ